MREFFTAPWEKVFPAPELSLAELALVEPLAVGLHAVARAELSPDDTVVVLGCGMIGLSVIAGAARENARIIAVDLDQAKLDLAASAGASDVINTLERSLHEALLERTDGEGPRVIIEAVGLPETFRAAVEEVSYAGRVIYIGYASEPVEYQSQLFVKKELDILGARNSMPVDFDSAIDLLRSQQVPVQQIISETQPFARAGEVLEQWDQNPQGYTKIQIAFDDRKD